MYARISIAAFRALLVAGFVVVKSALVAQTGSVEGDLFVFTVALLVALFVFIEYASDMPSMLEFRYAPPYNRMRFLIAVVIAFALCSDTYSQNLFYAEGFNATTGNSFVGIFSIWPAPGHYLYTVLDYANQDPVYWLFDNVALASMLGFACVLVAGIYIWISPWPLGREGFNLWPNMPSFNPASGRSASDLLAVVALANIILFFVLPYCLTFLISLAQQDLGFDFRYTPVFTFWVLFTWITLPLFCLFKAIALLKLCVLAESLRKLESGTE